MSDLGADAAKTGMLANAAIVEAVAAAVEDLEIPLLVVDPVMIAKSGDRLLDDEALGAMKAELLRKAFLVTPNIPEAETLAGIAIRTDDDRREAARRIRGARPVGRHHQGRAPAVGRHRRPAVRRPAVRRVPSRAGRRTSTHGTGCTFAAALTAHLALGDDARRGDSAGAGLRRRRHPACAGPGTRARPDGSFLGSVYLNRWRSWR